MNFGRKPPTGAEIAAAMRNNAFGTPSTYVAPPPLTPLQQAEREVERLKGTVEDQRVSLARIQERGHPMGVVVQIRESHVVVAVGQQFVEAQRPTNALPGGELEEGCTVRILQEGFQIVDVVRGFDFGTVHEVLRVLEDGLVEIAAQPAPRAIIAGRRHKVETGHRVVVDATMVAVQKNLGPKDNKKHAAKKATGVSWCDVIGQDAAVGAMKEAVEDHVTHAALYAEMGKRRSKGILLSGPPGIGKTLLMKAAATAVAALHGKTFCDEGFAYIKGPELANKWFGQSEENVRAIFSNAKEYFAKTGAPQLVAIDEAESILRSRARRDSANASVDVNIVQAFLAELDGLEDGGIFLVLATNRPEDLDPAIIRDGRLDTKIRMGRPSKGDVEKLALHYLAGSPTVADRELLAHELAEAVFSPHRVLGLAHGANKEREKLLFGHVASGALVAGIVEQAKQVAIRRLKDGKGARAIETADVDAAVEAKYVEALGGSHLDAADDLVRGKLVRFEPARDAAPKTSLIVAP
jgi:proteasome-associated ATPase